MSSIEKKIAVVLVVILVALVGVYVVSGNRDKTASGASAAGTEQASAGGSGASCAAPGGEAAGTAKTEELGKAGAKMEIVAVVPVAHGCHATTIEELKKAYKAHPNDIHLTVVDAFGPEAKTYQEKAGIQWVFVSLNGSTKFEMDGKKMQLERAEGQSYSPSDLVPLVEQELKKG
jgi:hypothetical protein